MKTKRSEETKKLVLKAAEKLFSKKGYDAVSIREIAKEANCSHTTMYVYFKDKEELLHQLSMPALLQLRGNMIQITESGSDSPEDRLKKISNEFIQFCLRNKNVFSIFINAKSTRLDELNPDMEINKVRLEIFALMKQMLGESLSIPDNTEQLMAFSRIYFYNLYGILNTYSYQHEPTEVLIERITPTFTLAFDILIMGFKEKLKEGEENE
ncbi:TetR/AcrR family transcriptional regulator [Oceanobacillus damuensis]|uniref:TetR/AcrR family transcriptional regulator n=1 Tax=Oceanobacillus damuensis TaxID=937928 RepID=UPI00082E92B0|nr:TetR/AcrR family transcriptional regulator [Oceanobacillus damuensis]